MGFCMPLDSRPHPETRTWLLQASTCQGPREMRIWDFQELPLPALISKADLFLGALAQVKWNTV